jgi:hypothetical protein
VDGKTVIEAMRIVIDTLRSDEEQDRIAARHRRAKVATKRATRPRSAS